MTVENVAKPLAESGVHQFKSYILDPVPEKLWRNVKPVEGVKVGFCETCSFYHVHPYFSEDYLKKYYSSYEMPTEQANLAETARLLARNIENKNARILDLGCGDGKFLNELKKLGFSNLHGIDQSPGVVRAMDSGIANFENISVWDYLDRVGQTKTELFDAVVLVNVLEHVVEPLSLMKRISNLIKPGGRFCVSVPNDFSLLQQAFLKVKGHLPWFVCLPDHLNYFSFATLEKAFNATGYDVIDQSALYPLELFLLQDLDYIKDPQLGPVAHKRRVEFEENMKKAGMTEALDQFYNSLAKGGFGRDVMMVAQKNKI